MISGDETVSPISGMGTAMPFLLLWFCRIQIVRNIYDQTHRLLLYWFASSYKPSDPNLDAQHSERKTHLYHCQNDSRSPWRNAGVILFHYKCRREEENKK